MIAKSIALALLIVLIRAGSVAAQTSGELLQKGIYTQDTAGDLDAAIKIYRQVLGSAPVREIGAQAQYRLAESLLMKGDLTGAGQEFQTLARLYPDQQALVMRLAARFPKPEAFGRSHSAGAAIGASDSDLFHSLYDPNRPVVVNGVITSVEWTNPRVVIYLGTGDRTGPKSAFTIGAPNALLRGGLNKNTFKVGDAIEIHGLAAKATGADPSGTNRTLPGGRLLDDNTLHAAAKMIILPNSGGKRIFVTDGVKIIADEERGR